jgi:paraquat-inducible protein A
MGSQGRQSLFDVYPKRFDVPAAIIASGALLALGLALPILSVEKLVFWKDEYSVITGIVALFREGHYILGLVVLTFSVVFPTVKVVVLAMTWFIPASVEKRHRVLGWLRILGPWSMMDVFAVALIVVIAKAGPLAKAQARAGIYLFAAAVVAAMLSTLLVEHLAKRAASDNES